LKNEFIPGQDMTRSGSPRSVPADAPYIQFLNVQKTYDGNNLVIDDLNLSIARGEFLTLLGPSGSGKTTMLMMLAGFEPVTEGQILLAGRPIQNVPPNKRDIGMVFQNYALFPHLTVAENLAFPLQVRNLSRADIAKKMRKALEMVQLSSLENRRPGQLSGGQQQRVALARALVFEPALVLMDEPLGALDRQLREQMQYEIKRIHGSLGVTVVYVTHDQGEALTMSSRIAIFYNGRIQQVATPDEIYEQPQSIFVARFIGENNILVGKVRDVKGDVCSVELDSGVMVHAKPVNVGGVGTGTSLSLRPERVAIANEAERMPNLFEGEVLEVTYLGDHVRARLRLCGSEHFIIKLPNIRGRQKCEVGSRLIAGWSIEDCFALDVDGTV
jgi:putative spermidine/putrescine transport system ATP-binding protein